MKIDSNSENLYKFNRNIVIGLSCNNCRTISSLSQNVCKNCRSGNLKKVGVMNRGIISSFTIVRNCFLGVKKHVLIAKVITLDGYCLIGNVVLNSRILSKNKINLIGKTVLIYFEKIDMKCYIKI